MRAPRIRAALPFGLVLLTVLPLGCATTGPPRYWTEFSATVPNFKRYFDRRGQDLEPIEGIWPGFAIVRDSSFEAYDYLGIRLPEPPDVHIIVAGGDTAAAAYADSLIAQMERSQARYRGAIFIALRRVASMPGVYEYTDAAVLRGKRCRDEPCHGVYVITAGGILLRQRFAVEVYRPEPGWVRKYPPP